MASDYDLRRVKTKDQLLTYVGIDKTQFDSALSFSVAKYEEQAAAFSKGVEITISYLPDFTKHQIPKKNANRGYRIVWSASPHLNNVYKGLARRLTLFLEQVIPNFPHSQNCGYVRGRNIRENAQFHVGAEFVLKADIQDYFPTISVERISQFFEQLGIKVGVAKLLANFLCIGGKLPLGLPTSPIIANAISHFMDIELHCLAEKSGVTYSRYADDLTFSSNADLPQIDEVSKIIDKHGFTLAPDKTRYSRRGQNHYVTGLSISEVDVPHVPRKMKRALRQELFYAHKYGLEEHLNHLGLTDDFAWQSYINHLDGRVKYVAYHEPKLAKKIVPLWNEILLESGESVSFTPKDQHRNAFHFYVDESELELGGEKYLALGMSATQHQEHINDVTKRIWEDYLADPWSDGDLEQIYKKGMHFTDATEDLRKAFLKALQPLPFSGYIVYGKINGDYQGTYLRLLNYILKRRLMAAESRAAHFHFEQNDKVSETAISDAVQSELSDLQAQNNRHPEYAFTKIVDKNYFGVAAPDFMLATFRRYLMADPVQRDYQRRIKMFEMLRDKIRVIVNADTGEEFGRRKPLAISEPQPEEL